MGAWGPGIFEDDTSCDLLQDAMTTDAASFVKSAMRLNSLNYIEYDECQALIVAGVIADAVLNQSDIADGYDGFPAWRKQQHRSAVTEYRQQVIAGLKRVLADDSEIHELWQDSETDYPVWKANLERLIASLSSGTDTHDN